MTMFSEEEEETTSIEDSLELISSSWGKALETVQHKALDFRIREMRAEDLEVITISGDTLQELWERKISHAVCILHFTPPFKTSISVTTNSSRFLYSRINRSLRGTQIPFLKATLIIGNEDTPLSYPEACYLAGLLEQKNSNLNVPRVYRTDKMSKKERKVVSELWRQIDRKVI